jgi:hypothetical protein
MSSFHHIRDHMIFVAACALHEAFESISPTRSGVSDERNN